MKTIGIIGAMPSELNEVHKRLSGATVEKHSGFDYYVSQVQDAKVIHVCSGIAKVNAAVCAQIMIDTYHIDALINAGVAGGMQPMIHVCDIVISSEVLPHDLDLHFLQDYPPYCGIYPADKHLIQIAHETCDALGIPSWNGRIVSGEAFISNDDIKEEITKRLNPYAVDMESSAIGHCAYVNKVPFVSIRCISDNADAQGETSFNEFETVSAARVADVVIRMIPKV